MSPPIPSRVPITSIVSPAQSPQGFNPDAILVRLLEGDDPDIHLSETLVRQGNLAEALHALPPAQVQQIQAACGDQYEALLALSQERNPDRFFESLVNIGLNLENQDCFEMAGRIYQTIVALHHGLELSPSRQTTVARAQQRLELFSGHGTWGDRFQFWGRRVLRDSVDPTLLAGIGAGTLAYRSTRFAVLTRLFRPVAEAELARAVSLGAEEAMMFRPSTFYRTRAALLSGWAGVNVETMAYMAATRLTDELRGRSPDWSEEGVRGELRNSYLIFTGMHLGGALFSLMARRSFRMGSTLFEGEALPLMEVEEQSVSGELRPNRRVTINPEDWTAPVTRTVTAQQALDMGFVEEALSRRRPRGPLVRIPETATRFQRIAHEGAVQMGMFSGIVLAHRAAENLGIVPEHSHQGDLLGDSLRFFVQASVMRALSAPLYRQQTLAMDRSLSGAGGLVWRVGQSFETGEGTD